jgi:hypothetical protein
MKFNFKKNKTVLSGNFLGIKANQLFCDANCIDYFQVLIS